MEKPYRINVFKQIEISEYLSRLYKVKYPHNPEDVLRFHIDSEFNWLQLICSDGSKAYWSDTYFDTGPPYWVSSVTDYHFYAYGGS